MSKCILCGMNAVLNRQDNAGRTIYNCPGCGVFVISDIVSNEVEANKMKIGAFLAHRNLMRLDDIVMISLGNVQVDKGYLHMTVEQIVDAFPSSFRRRSELVLQNLIYKSEYPGYEIKVESLRNGPLLYLEKLNFEAMAYAISALERDGLVTLNHHGTSSFFPCGIIVTPEGWDVANDMDNGQKSQDSVFVWGSKLEDDDEAYREAISKACKRNGFEVLDIVVTGGDIHDSDRLAAGVKGSKCVICDLSVPSPGAYLVMGMAVALKRTLILTCRSEDKSKLKIDTEQLSVMFWDNPVILSERVDNAIRARVF